MLFAPYRGIGVVTSANVGASPYAMLFDPVRVVLENIPHEEVFRGCTIIGIFFDSWIAIAIQVNRHEKLFERSEFFE